MGKPNIFISDKTNCEQESSERWRLIRCYILTFKEVLTIMMNERLKKIPYFTWGCSDELSFRLRKTLYCSEEDGCFDSSSAALTDVAVSMLQENATKSRRKLSHRYASSLTRQLSISPCALMMSILYSERLRQLNPGYLEKVSSSDLYVVAMLVATKFLHDEGEQEEIYNDEWAEAAGLAVSTVNRLEREFLDAIDWNIYVHPDEFLEFCSKIETKIAFKYGLQRGWFSYTDLNQFLLEVNYQNILKGILERTVRVIGGCALIYGMSLSLLVSSVITYAAVNTANRINYRSTSTLCNNVTSIFETNTDTSSFLTYKDRMLTRQRSSLHTDDPDVDERNQMDNVIIDARNNTTASVKTEIQRSFSPCNCHTKVCFESSFQHEMRQTNIFYGLDSLDMHLCNNQKYVDRNIRDERFTNRKHERDYAYDYISEDLNKGWINRFGITTRRNFHNVYDFIQQPPTMFGMLVM